MILDWNLGGMTRELRRGLFQHTGLAYIWGMIDSIAAYREQFLEYLGAITPKDPPDGLYEPVRYILEMGGKRMRPVLVLLSADLFGASRKEALPAAAAATPRKRMRSPAA